MFSIQCRIDYADTDAMGVMHHSRYFRYLERARVDFLRHHGLSYSELEKQDYLLPLRSANIDYELPLFFDDEFTIQVNLNEVKHVSFWVEYEIFKNEKLCAKARTFHVWCRRKVLEGGETELKPTKAPPEWRNLWLKLKPGK